MSTVTGCGASWMLRGITWSSLVCACLIAALPGAADTKGTDKDSLRTEEIERLRRSYRGDRPLGAIVFRCEDAQHALALDSIDICPVFSGERRTGYRDSRRTDWLAPKAYSYDFVCPGYKTVQLRDIRIPADSLVLVTVRMTRGTDSVMSEEALSKHVTITRLGLDDIVRPNTIVGVVYDERAKAPVEGANIYCETLNRHITTDSKGTFILPLDTLRRVTLYVWHPAYDSITFDVAKDLIRTEKCVDVRYEERRDIPDSSVTAFSDSSTVLMVGTETWSPPPGALEDHLTISTFAVTPGEVFGPTSLWSDADCLPFRLIRTFPNRRAWIQFAADLGPIGMAVRDQTNFLTVTDSTAEVATASKGRAWTATLQLIHDYSPPGAGTSATKWPIPNKVSSTSRDATDSCAVIRAEVERVHLRNLLYFVERDFDSFAEAFSPEYHAPTDHFEPTAENWKRLFAEEDVPLLTLYRISELIRITGSQVYIYGECTESPYEMYLSQMNRAGLMPAKGDVYVSFPKAAGSPYGANWAAVYRRHDGKWKIITWGR